MYVPKFYSYMQGIPDHDTSSEVSMCISIALTYTSLTIRLVVYIATYVAVQQAVALEPGRSQLLYLPRAQSRLLAACLTLCSWYCYCYE